MHSTKALGLLYSALFFDIHAGMLLLSLVTLWYMGPSGFFLQSWAT